MSSEAAVSSMDPLIRAIISIGVLVFLAKLFANIASTMKLPHGARGNHSWNALWPLLSQRRDKNLRRNAGST